MSYVVIVFFFFKQKTAYEMRISDWSSDVCSSDMRQHHRVAQRRQEHRGAQLDPLRASRHAGEQRDRLVPRAGEERVPHTDRVVAERLGPLGQRNQRFRSEEHTSESQSLLRISHAVLCLTKKKKQKRDDTQ